MLRRDAVGRATVELPFARELVAEPQSGDEIGRDALIRAEVAVEREQNERVLLRVRPVTAFAPIEEAAHEFRE